MLTDEVSQVHRSPGFITSALIGHTNSGELIKEFEASHGTVSDLWDAHQRGEPTSLNPLGLVTALMESIKYASIVNNKNQEQIRIFTAKLRNLIHRSFVMGKGTKDLVGNNGLSTEEFISWIEKHLISAVDHWDTSTNTILHGLVKPSKKLRKN